MRRSPGIPVAIDPEATPAPRATPLPVDRSTISPPIAEHLDRLGAQMALVANGLEQVWSARHVPGQIDSMAVRVDDLARELADVTALIAHLIKPVTTANQGEIVSIRVALDRLTTQLHQFTTVDWPAHLAREEAAARQLAGLERELAGVGQQLGHVSGRVTEAAEDATDADRRLAAIEQVRQHAIVADAAVSADRARAVRIAGHVVKALIAAGGLVAGYLANHLLWR